VKARDSLSQPKVIRSKVTTVILIIYPFFHERTLQQRHEALVAQTKPV